MIPRRAISKVEEALSRQAAVALLGPRQVGYVNFVPLNVLEVENTAKTTDRLWLRGGFPDSYMLGCLLICCWCAVYLRITPTLANGS